ncbi:MAG: hypothetical protein P8172_02495 [Gammaproteobacteria bacterium]
MRNLVLLLLLANAIFFAWNRWVAQPPADGAVHFPPGETGSGLELADPVAEDTVTDAGREGLASPATSGPESLRSEMTAEGGRAAVDTATEAAPPTRCASIGPYEERTAAEAARRRVEDLGYAAALRRGVGELFLGHWVQIRDISSREESRRLLGILQANGVEEAYLVPEDDGDWTISLGLFSNLDRARRLERRGDALGLDVEIVRHTREATLHWVDVTVPAADDRSGLDEAAGRTGISFDDAAAECPRDAT